MRYVAPPTDEHRVVVDPATTSVDDRIQQMGRELAVQSRHGKLVCVDRFDVRHGIAIFTVRRRRNWRGWLRARLPFQRQPALRPVIAP